MIHSTAEHQFGQPFLPPPDVHYIHHAVSPRHNQRVFNLSQLRTEISQAAQRRDAPQVRRIVQHLLQTLTPNQLDECLALHYVVWTCELNSLADELIVYGCNVYASDINGDSVAHYCVKGCNLKYLKQMHTRYGYKLFTVLNNNHFNLFLTAAAEAPDDKAYDILSMLEWMHLSGSSLEIQDMQGRTPMMWACRRGSNILVQWLLSRGASLSARDHMGRTVLHMACLSGDDDAVLTVCEKGAINFYTVKSNDDSKARTPLQICFQRGHYFLGLSLKKFALQKSIFNSVKIFRSMYAWYYLILMAFNFMAFVPMALRIAHLRYDYFVACATWCGFFCGTSFFWLIAFFAEPSYVKDNVVPDQSWRCSASEKQDLDKRSALQCHPASQQYKLIQLEREMSKAGHELIYLNRDWGGRIASGNMPLEIEKKYDSCANKIQRSREQMFRMMEKIGAERRSECPPGYVRLFEVQPRSVCITCKIIKPFRAHHCSDCQHCIHRFDHHCVWVDNCIGKGNQRSFFFFLLCLTASIVINWCCVILFYKVVAEDPDGGPLSLLSEPISYLALFNSLLNTLWIGFVGYLLGRTCKSITTNITFYEYLKRPAHIMRRFGGITSGCCWDLKGLNPCKVVRNTWSYFVLDSRWDREDYPGVPPELPRRVGSAQHPSLPVATNETELQESQQMNKANRSHAHAARPGYTREGMRLGYEVDPSTSRGKRLLPMPVSEAFGDKPIIRKERVETSKHQYHHVEYTPLPAMV